jgi:hypothetical protein
VTIVEPCAWLDQLGIGWVKRKCAVAIGLLWTCKHGSGRI